jgi:N-acyl homoserine lactone hydrolase
MKLHAIQTGTVAIKTRQVEGVGRGSLRQLNMLLDREWTEPLPIYAYAIEHPEGVIVVDTGETARTSEPDYFPRWHPYYRSGVRLFVEPEQEIRPQLEQLGIRPGDVRRVVMTHMHTDHAGGLHAFPHSEILISRPDFQSKRRSAWSAARLSEQPVPGLA